MEEKDRINRILQHAMKDSQNDINLVEQKGNEIDERMRNMQKVVYDHVRRRCKNQVEWIQTHGRLIKSADGFRVQIDSNPGIEADAKIKEFSLCAAENDFGFKSFFEQVHREQDGLQSRLESCITNCLSRAKDNPDKILTAGVKDCIDNSLNSLKNTYQSIEEKLVSVKSRLL